MKDLLTRAISQLDKLDERLDSVDKTLIRQEENLREHMRRTDLLEKQHESLQKNMHDELNPIKSHIQQVKGMSKIILIAIPLLASLIGAVYKFM